VLDTTLLMISWRVFFDLSIQVDMELVQSKRRPSSRSLLPPVEPDAPAAAFTAVFLALDLSPFLMGAEPFLIGTALAALTGAALAAAFPLLAACVAAFFTFVAFAIFFSCFIGLNCFIKDKLESILLYFLFQSYQKIDQFLN